MSDLTEAERATLDEAVAIIAAHTPGGRASWSIAIHQSGLFESCCYFDSSGGQHMLWGKTSLSEVVQAGVTAERRAINADAQRRTVRIARLKRELDDLEAGAA